MILTGRFIELYKVANFVDNTDLNVDKLMEIQNIQSF